MKYKITIEEMISKDFEVEADNIYAELETAERSYRKGIFVLDPSTLVCKQISGEFCDEDDVVDWYEF